MGIRILTVKKMMTSLEVMVPSKENADYLADEAKKAGFGNVVVTQRAGVKGTNLYHIVIGTKQGGKVSEIVSFLENHSEVEYGKEE